ncbi:MAG TPA: bifunctional diaminohydroxyphosphoribosylaminopyrimidine deaminase/5-amino-6-(5-phosphoribosylamino)uracil reductase RibD [Candidatus Dormibacteraeota bacterium]|nr:bifunctional diaminohydroxyphosphoribosylaminopyrimidine deaminase/5-amino-6-(5-phosphoribosylamino)uracil reductase RibD [Candidatus Dormibacteraeota bacterium]
MRRAFELAALAEHATSPNPMVGAVVLDASGKNAGEGFHARAGDRHAERIALQRAGARAHGGTLYVTLEPCYHQGRTPPCTAAVIDAEPKRVVVAMEDPDSRVAGAGIAALRAAGIEVEVGVDREAAERLNRFYLKHRRTGRPWVTVKFASSVDGKIATRTGESRWITGKAAREEGHRLRQRHDAILVGAHTVRADDPELTNRLPDATRQPLRVVLDSRARTAETARVLKDQEKAPTIVVVTADAPADRREALARTGVEVVELLADATGRADLPSLLDLLGGRGILSVLVEGGAFVHGALFDAGLVDGVVAFLAPIVIGGKEAPGAVGGQGVAKLAEAGRLVNLEVNQVGDDIMVSGDVHRDR